MRNVLGGLVLILLAWAPAPAAGAVGIAYLDNGNVQVATVDGATKAAVTSDGTLGEGTARLYEAVAQTPDGKIFTSSRNCTASPCTHSFSQYSPLGAKVSEYFPGYEHNGPVPTFPLGFDVTPSGSNIAYGWQQASNSTFSRGLWVEPGDHTAAAPKPFELDIYNPTFWGDRIVGVGYADNKVFVQTAAGAPYANTYTEWLTFGDGSFLHFVRAAVAPNGTTFAFTAYDSQPEPDAPATMALGKFSVGTPPDGTFAACDFPTGPNPEQVTFSPDSSLMAWKDDQGVKVVAVPAVSGDVCAPATPTVISATGDEPALGGIDVPALIASRQPPPGNPGGGTGPGGTGGGNPAPGADTTAPAFTARPKFTPSSFRSLPSGATISAAARGAKLGFTLSEAATIKLTITGGAAGKRVKGRCVKPTRANRRASKCTRTVTLGSASKAVPAGAVSLRFSGRAAGKALKRGKYTARFVATDAAGNASAAVTAKFTIVK
jgi:hypothetical protein